jgi:hypothetical protein
LLTATASSRLGLKRTGPVGQIENWSWRFVASYQGAYGTRKHPIVDRSPCEIV